ncbi:MAG: hypothetical protein J0L82_07025 [Deltaproteobacteria bacterium]|jgi:uncharacterized protein YfiM (DUF2279 family)|nr:hypothetical protein [Deltaproteobacteria bacterium]
MAYRYFMRMTYRLASVALLVAFTAMSPVRSADGFQSDASAAIPGSQGALGINGKDSVIYANLGKVAALALRQNREPIVDPVVGGAPLSGEGISEEFANYCLDADFSDKVAWRRAEGGEIWLQFSCLKDGEYPAIRERLFVITTAPVSGRAGTWKLVDLQLLSADIEPGSKLEFKSAAGSGFKSPIARATVAITGAVLLSALAAKRTYPGQDDKVHHSVAAGVLAAGAASYLHFIIGMSPEKSAMAGGAISLLVGGGKEVLDPLFTGVRSKHDMKANTFGAVLGTVTVYLSFKFN